MKTITKLLLLISVLSSCAYTEDLCTPNQNDGRILDITEKWITWENGMGTFRTRNRENLPDSLVGTLLICEDEYRFQN